MLVKGSANLVISDSVKNLHKKYAPSQKVYDLVSNHCLIVAEICLWCARKSKLTLNIDLLIEAALLHDLGTYVLYNQQAEIINYSLYKLHPIIGVKILEEEGLNTQITDIIQTHLLLGVSRQEIIDNRWLMPANDYIPSTIEGRLLAYADNYHSKKPLFNSYQTINSFLSSTLPLQAKKFQKSASEFGIPDVQLMASTYQQPVS